MKSNKFQVRQIIYVNGEIWSNELSEDYFYSISECREFISSCRKLDKNFIPEYKVEYIIEVL